MRRQSANFYTRSLPRYYALGGGTYWLRNVGIDETRNEPPGSILRLAVPEGTFRLRATATGDTLFVEQQAAGSWQPRLHLSLRPVADSLRVHYASHPEGDSYAEQPLPLQARAGRVRLRLFLTSFYWEKVGEQEKYVYSADGELRVRP